MAVNDADSGYLTHFDFDGNLTSDISVRFQNKSGTVALLEDTTIEIVDLTAAA